MPSPSQPSEEHQVGVTSAQEKNPDPVIADLTRRTNAEFQAGRYADAGRLALEMTARSKDELAATFQRHGVTLPAYDVHVDGRTDDVLAAASEFGTRHAQEMVLIAKKVKPGDSDVAARLGLTVTLRAAISVEEAVVVAEFVKACGFQGATFAPKRDGEVAIYHTETLGMTAEEFATAAAVIVQELKKRYAQLTTGMQKFIIQMPRL